jgi:asparagine synthase (glutamine-hydrolysing)
MCGIAGFLSSESIDKKCELKKMGEALSHRGPNDNGLWFDDLSGVGLSHTRLSVIDLSITGHQPMVSHSKRYTIVFNGEIYNHEELRKGTGIDTWNGQSDTESLLASVERWGVDLAVKKMSGMFAFALWDSEKKELTLCRDRLGEKPLYYGWSGKNFIFGSELKALKSFYGFSNAIDRNSLTLFLRYNCIPAPYSIYEGIFKLEPGHIASIKLGDSVVKSRIYWSINDKNLKNQCARSEVETLDQLDDTLKKSVSRQMMSDVQIGAFLSGGIDSSLIAALMQKNSKKRLKTFSIGFENKDYNEAEHARAVAKYLDTDHYDLYVSDETLRSVIPLLPTIYDEPFADPSQIPTYLVSKIAKEKVTVCLTGDGADELFGGYSRYSLAYRSWNKLKIFPLHFRKIIKFICQGLPYGVWLFLFKIFRLSVGKLDRFLKAINLLDCKSKVDFYHQGFMSQNNQASKWVLEKKSTEYRTAFDIYRSKCTDYYKDMMNLDLLHYMQADTLTKVDRASMFVSLETRSPFLDPSVVQFSFTIPTKLKIKKYVNKYILRKLLYKYIPREIVDRPKMGFSVPLSDWLRGPLKEWAEEMLDKDKLDREGFFDSEIVTKKWNEHLSGKRNWHYQLWAVLMFQSWLDNNT